MTEKQFENIIKDVLKLSPKNGDILFIGMKIPLYDQTIHWITEMLSQRNITAVFYCGEIEKIHLIRKYTIDHD